MLLSHQNVSLQNTDFTKSAPAGIYDEALSAHLFRMIEQIWSIKPIPVVFALVERLVVLLNWERTKRIYCSVNCYVEGIVEARAAQSFYHWASKYNVMEIPQCEVPKSCQTHNRDEDAVRCIFRLNLKTNKHRDYSLLEERHATEIAIDDVQLTRMITLLRDKAAKLVYRSVWN